MLSFVFPSNFAVTIPFATISEDLGVSPMVRLSLVSVGSPQIFSQFIEIGAQIKEVNVIFI